MDDGFCPQWHALELVARGVHEDPAREQLRTLLTDARCDPAELYAQALVHRLVPLLAHHVQEAEAQGALPKIVRLELAQAYFRQSAQTELLTREAERLGDALAAAGVKVAFAKGVVLANTVYEAPGARSMHDIDIMARPDDAAVIHEAMTELGYVMGDYSFRERRVVPMERKVALQYRLYPDHIPQYARANDDAVQPCFIVDFSHTFTWVNSRWQIDLDAALAGAARFADEVRLPILDPIHHFLRVALHIFREGWLEHWIVREDNDITLRKIADVVRFWARHRDDLVDGRLARAVYDLGVAEPVAWVLAHVDAVCGTRLLAEAELTELGGEDWLRSAAGGNEAPLRWHGDIRRRLHDRTQLTLERVAT